MEKLEYTRQATAYLVVDTILKEKVLRTYDAFIKYMNDTYNLEECLLSSELRKDGVLVIYVD